MFCSNFIKNNSNKTPIELLSNLPTMVYIILGSIISAIGLLYDQESVVLGSMLLSPLSTPIMYYIVGLFNHDYMYFFTHIFSLIVLCIICVFTGVIISFINQYKEVFKKPSKQMKSRAKNDPFLQIDSFIAFMAGFIMIIGTIYPNMMVLSGLALIVAFLPPLVNSGLYLGNYLYNSLLRKGNKKIQFDLYGSMDNIGLGIIEFKNPLQGALNSFLLALANMVAYSVGAFLAMILLCKKS